MLLGEPHEPLPGQSGSHRFREGTLHAGVAVRVGQDLQLPGLSRQPHLPTLLKRELVRRRIASTVRRELLLWRQVLQFRDRLVQKPLGFVLPARPQAGRLEHCSAGGSEPEEVTARQVGMFFCEFS